MSPQKIIDSHIHLWPKETCNVESHAWMTPPDMPLAKPHLLANYYQVADGNPDVEVKGVVYVETDVSYDTPDDDVSSWAKGPLDEIGFLRATVEGKYHARDSDMLIALVPWAPMNQPTAVLEEYLALAQERAGPVAWPRVKGFRFLLQSITDQVAFEKLVLGHDFIANLKLLGKRRFSFDTGVDQHRAATWQLNTIAKAMGEAQANVPEHEKVTFVINHLCKPDYRNVSSQASASQDGAFSEWCNAISTLARCEKTYMKLSGQFSEIPPATGAQEAAMFCKPWLMHALQCFGPKRVMFGSDWPVCNVSGPLREKSWVAWKDVVKITLADAEYGLDDEDREWIWYRTAIEAYRIG
ncbi:hypothetical protein LTR62_007053 [Meristemomyces frigidus]|uniref:Amidohydrolase-related domain-containing protein n=1 Tax=Meristemomyces frigidus TaxID=1508187 RepID=A0AAN7TB28_9PEZI|nr:hypothetical protein LTR62_007053 [Meristemomyces frigidus]